MNLYNSCNELVSNSFKIEAKKNIKALSTQKLINDHCTQPANLQALDFGNWYFNKVYYISDIHIDNHILNQFSHPQDGETIINYVKSVVKQLFKGEFLKDIKRGRNPIVIFGGDIASSFSISKYFYTFFLNQWRNIIEKQCLTYPKTTIYAVLGNHEFWDFKSYNECIKEYQHLFDTLNIKFLNNSYDWFGIHFGAHKKTKDGYVLLNKQDNPQEYDYYMKLNNNVIIIGGVGFAANNEEFNANCGIYRDCISRKEEIELSKKWKRFYEDSLTKAQTQNTLLIVLTHNPISDWTDTQPSPNCVYFNGHTHRNILLNLDNNTNIFSDNQIGYSKKTISLKNASIFRRYNPFSVYNDGIHEINSADYASFYAFNGESIGIGTIDIQIRDYGAKLYMMKKDELYCFLLASDKSVYICNGGTLKKISKAKNLDYFYEIFPQLTETYINALMPFRKKQLEISNFVKSFGGSGQIHGSIIDIDFTNHIMLDGYTGELIYYNSPMFGYVKKHRTLQSLIENHCQELLPAYETVSKNNLPSVPNITTNEDFIKVDIKNSGYAISRKLKDIQRLFEKNILRVWDESLLLHDNNKRTIKQLPDSNNNVVL